MAYLIGAHEPLAKALPRAIGEQSIAARAHLQRHGSDLHEGVHDARRAIRRARAALALLRPQLDATRWTALGLGFAEAGRALSPLRDAQSVIEAVTEQLQQPGLQLPAPELQRLMANLRRRRGRAVARAAGVISIADAALARAVGGLQTDFAGFDEAALARGIRLGRRRLRKALERARGESPDSESLHRFRQRARTHWLQLELLVDAWPIVIAAQAAESKKLSQLLGSERDLHLLAGVIARAGRGSVQSQALAEIEAHIVRLRAQLLERAFRLGDLVCAESGAALAERIRRLRRARAAHSR